MRNTSSSNVIKFTILFFLIIGNCYSAIPIGKVGEETSVAPQWMAADAVENYAKNFVYRDRSEKTTRSRIFRVAQTELPRKTFLGAQIAPLTPEIGARLKLGAEQQGLIITRVDAQSSAADAGLAIDDVIVKINEAAVGTPNQFVAIVRNFKVGDKFQLTLFRNGQPQTKIVTLKPRPLETNPNFDVLYRAVETKGGRRRVIVTKPKTNGKFPAVLLVGGIGCYSLDNFPPTHAYRKILYGLTEQGFATMRVEKTGMGDSEGAPCSSPQADLRQEVEGYVAGLKALKTYDFVDAGKTFIFGHSIGGIVGPLVAAEVPVRGIIVSETIGTNWFEYALENYRRQAILRGAPYDEAEAEAKLNRLCKQRLWLDNQTTEQVIRENSACDPFLRDPAAYTYMQQLSALNLAEIWKKVAAPTLIIYGSSDFLTSSKEHEYLRNMINSFEPNRAAYIEIAGMDHYFESAATQRESMERLNNPPPSPPQFVERSLNEISNWLKRNLTDSPDSATVSGAAQAKISVEEFQNLRWIEGDWRGTENGRNPFYERYRFAGENRIEMQSFKDEAMTQISAEKSVTVLMNGAILHQAGQGVWTAEKLSKTEISFVPRENARNSFVWRAESPDVWTAQINFTDRDGRLKQTIYRLERIKK